MKAALNTQLPHSMPIRTRWLHRRSLGVSPMDRRDVPPGDRPRGERIGRVRVRRDAAYLVPVVAQLGYGQLGAAPVRPDEQGAIGELDRPQVVLVRPAQPRERV